MSPGALGSGLITTLPLTQVGSQGATFAVADPMERAGHAPLVEAGRPAMGFDVSGESSGPLALGHQAALRHRMLTTRKRSDQKHPCLTSRGNGCRGVCGDHRPPGHPPGEPLLNDRDDAAQHLPIIHSLHTTFLGTQGANAINLLLPQPKQLGHHHKRTVTARRMAEQKTWAQLGRSRLQDAASPSVGKRASRFCDPCDPTSCCNGLVSCGSDGAECKA